MRFPTKNRRVRIFIVNSWFLFVLPLLAFGEASPGVSELDGIKSLLKKEEPITWVITGDSITHGALHTHGRRSYPEHFAERVRWEMRRVRDVVINTGISGDRVPGLLSDLEHRVIRFRPNVVFVMLGMNDATEGEEGRAAFREKYRELVNRLREETDALILLQTPNPITPAAENRQDLPAYSQIVREIAAETEVALVDQERMWKEYLSEEKNDLNYFLNDGTLHPNAAGHILFAHNLFHALEIFDPQSRTCRLYVP